MTQEAPAKRASAAPPAGVRAATIFRRAALLTGIHRVSRQMGLNRFAAKAMLRRYESRPKSRVDIRAGGLDLVVPGPQVRWYLFDQYEPLTMQWLEARVRPGWRVLDVGASIGYFSLSLARLVGPEGHVTACEPVAETVEILRTNILANNAANVTVVETAIGDVVGRRSIHLTAAGNLDGFYGNPQGKTLQRRDVAVTTVDSIADGAFDLVKIDVEGAEIDVLDGMHEALAAVQAIVVEWNPACLVAAGVDPRDLPARLLDAGLDVQVLDEGAARTRTVSEVLDELESGSLDPRWYGNLVALR